MARLVAAAAIGAAALVVLASIHDGVVDAGADLALVASLVSLARAVFGLVD